MAEAWIDRRDWNARLPDGIWNRLCSGQAMIVKLGQEFDWKIYKRLDTPVKAVKMREDFLLETVGGWVQGHKGDWLVEVAPDKLRFVCHDAAFIKTYKPWEEKRMGIERRQG